MSDCVAHVINVTKVRFELRQLLATYLAEKEENQQDNDAHGIEYWDSACLTIEEVAEALSIALGVEADEPSTIQTAPRNGAQHNYAS